MATRRVAGTQSRPRLSPWKFEEASAAEKYVGAKGRVGSVPTPAVPKQSRQKAEATRKREERKNWGSDLAEGAALNSKKGSKEGSKEGNPRKTIRAPLHERIALKRGTSTLMVTDPESSKFNKKAVTEWKPRPSRAALLLKRAHFITENKQEKSGSLSERTYSHAQAPSTFPISKSNMGRKKHNERFKAIDQ